MPMRLREPMSAIQRGVPGQSWVVVACVQPSSRYSASFSGSGLAGSFSSIAGQR